MLEYWLYPMSEEDKLKCVCELCEDQIPHHSDNWIKDMTEANWPSGYRSVQIVASELKGRLSLCAYVVDNRNQAYASNYFPKYCPECGRKLIK